MGALSHLPFPEYIIYSDQDQVSPIKAIQNSWAASKKLKKFFRSSRKQMCPDSRAGNLQKDLEVHVCHVSMVNRKLEVGPSHG